MAEHKEQDILIWVGTKFYPTIAKFVEEATRLGCSRRLPMIRELDDRIIPGETKCFLAHDEGKRGHGRIFGYFVISRIEVIVQDEQHQEEMRKQIGQLADDGKVTYVPAAVAAKEPARGCGHRVVGGVYAVSDKDALDKLYDQAKEIGEAVEVVGPIILFKKPLDYNAVFNYRSGTSKKYQRFRGYKFVDGADILTKAEIDKYQRVHYWCTKGAKGVRFERKGKGKAKQGTFAFAGA